MASDFSDLTPPRNLVENWSYGTMDPGSGGGSIQAIATCAARWGAEQAAERLKGQWPLFIENREPEFSDGDEDGYVQAFVQGRIVLRNWRNVTGALSAPWLHTPRWQPPAPPTLREQALKRVTEVLNDPQAPLLADWITETFELARRALEAESWPC